MKKNKMTVVASFCIGALLFAVTSYADIVAKTGYGQLKESLKVSAQELTKEGANFSSDFSISIKDGATPIYVSKSEAKVDNVKSITVNSSKYFEQKEEGSSYYDSEDVSISKYSFNDEYNLTKYQGKNLGSKKENPFEHERAKDIEKIVDAFVGNFNGNLKDFIVLNEMENGTKEISTQINQGQVPSLVNAVSSFLFKEFYNNMINSGRRDLELYDENSKINKINKLEDDIFIKNVEFKGLINSNGILENLLASGTVNAVDSKGVSHEFSFDLLIKIYDVGTTVVQKPDLKGKKVIESEGFKNNPIFVSKKFIGKYRADIIQDSPDKFIKLGESIIEITKIDDKYVYGKRTGSVTNEGAEFKGKIKDFSFKAKINGLDSGIIFDENENVEDIDLSDYKQIDKISKGNIYFNSYNGTIYFNFDQLDIMGLTGEYKRIFE